MASCGSRQMRDFRISAMHLKPHHASLSILITKMSECRSPAASFKQALRLAFHTFCTSITIDGGVHRFSGCGKVSSEKSRVPGVSTN